MSDVRIGVVIHTNLPKTIPECDDIYEKAAQYLPPGMYFFTAIEPCASSITEDDATNDDWGIYHLYSAGDVKLREDLTLFDLMSAAERIWLELFDHTRHWFVTNGLVHSTKPQWRTYADQDGQGADRHSDT